MEFVILIIEVLIVLQLVLGLASLCTWIERKGSALVQDRIGANRAGAFVQTKVWWLKPVYALVRILGILGVINTLLCDAAKAVFKEDFIPEGVSNFMHSLAPFLAVLPVFVAFAIVPLAPEFSVFGQTIRFQIAPQLNVGILFFLAMASLAVYGVILAGLTANNKYALLGALRAAAQMISYELALGAALATVILVYGSFDLYDMVQAQQGRWGVFYNPMMFVACILIFVCGIAETKRVPFDLPESESELTAGYFTEYSGMKFLLFWLAEFAEIALISLVMALVFFGGWHPLPFVALPEGPWWSALLGHAVLMSKVVFFCTLQIVIRWTLPRFRFDQLMGLGWKVLLEVSFINLLLAAALKLV